MGRIVAIVGRPNVGKSTFFNRLTESHDAIVDEVSGVTRDRHYGKSEWSGIEFSIIDTGGYVQGSEDVFEEEIRKQVNFAIDEADVILFMVDVTTGITDYDEEVAILLRKRKKNLFLVVNKVDNPKRHDDLFEFYNLGLGELYPISSMTGHGTGELLDEVVKVIKDNKPEDLPELPKIAIVGRPNAGKSTLINTLIEEDRFIVTPQAGTTRDTIFTRYNKYNHDFYLVDTAGIRKKAKVTEDLEFYSVMRSIRAIENSDICVLLIDATHGLEGQDINIFHLIQKNNKGLILVVNKWDLMEKETNTIKSYTEFIKNKISPFTDIPIIFISAINKQRIGKLLDIIEEVIENKKRKIPTSKLNDVMLAAIENHTPPRFRDKVIKIKYTTQIPTHVPSFIFYCNYPQHIDDSYKRYLENRLRENFNFTGVPIQLFFRKK